MSHLTCHTYVNTCHLLALYICHCYQTRYQCISHDLHRATVRAPQWRHSIAIRLRQCLSRASSVHAEYVHTLVHCTLTWNAFLNNDVYLDWVHTCWIFNNNVKGWRHAFAYACILVHRCYINQWSLVSFVWAIFVWISSCLMLLVWTLSCLIGSDIVCECLFSVMSWFLFLES